MNRINKANLILAENLVEDIMDKFEACGIAAAIIDGDGNTVFEKFWGVRDKESGKEMNGDTIFGIASVTKSFTCLAIMQMEERGILDLTIRSANIFLNLLTKTRTRLPFVIL